MATGKFIAYLRVSTQKQGASGLGLEAQRSAVETFLNGGRWEVIETFIEVESGKNDDRPKLAEALSLCRLHNATLVIAKLDRLSRDAHFLLGLQKAGVRFVAADMPEANEMVVGIMAVIAQAERKMIGKRTKEALAVKRDWYANLTDDERAALEAKGKPTRLGGDRGKFADIRHLGTAKAAALRKQKAIQRTNDLVPRIQAMQAKGMTIYAVGKELTRQGIPTPRGKARWVSQLVLNVMAHAT